MIYLRSLNLTNGTYLQDFEVERLISLKIYKVLLETISQLKFKKEKVVLFFLNERVVLIQRINRYDILYMAYYN